jgi:hypothetical protein
VKNGKCLLPSPLGAAAALYVHKQSRVYGSWLSSALAAIVAAAAAYCTVLGMMNYILNFKTGFFCIMQSFGARKTAD